jgi:hypothetical protein
MQEIPEVFKRWLKECGNGESVPRNYLHDDNDFMRFTPDFGIQQNLDEIMSFLDFVDPNKQGSILEIGLGYYGSSHFLFKSFFKHVLTVEFSIERTRNFFRHLDEYKDSCEDIGSSAVVIGDSINPLTFLKVTKHMNEVGIDGFDCLFIDGYHSLQYVLGDHQLYSSLVKPGGIIAFHDSLSPMLESGVPTYISLLEQGLGGQGKVEFQRIEISLNLGIAFYRV